MCSRLRLGRLIEEKSMQGETALIVRQFSTSSDITSLFKDREASSSSLNKFVEEETAGYLSEYFK